MYAIERRDGLYVGHKLNERTGMVSARFSWKNARHARRYASVAEAEGVIAAQGMQRCRVVLYSDFAKGQK